jgi:hypothetical protein
MMLTRLKIEAVFNAIIHARIAMEIDIIQINAQNARPMLTGSTDLLKEKDALVM